MSSTVNQIWYTIYTYSGHVMQFVIYRNNSADPCLYLLGTVNTKYICTPVSPVGHILTQTEGLFPHYQLLLEVFRST